jgi:hypothetical protein
VTHMTGKSVAKKRATGAVFTAKPLGQGRVSTEFIETLEKTGASDAVVKAANRKSSTSKRWRADKVAHYERRRVAG